MLTLMELDFRWRLPYLSITNCSETQWPTKASSSLCHDFITQTGLSRVVLPSHTSLARVVWWNPLVCEPFWRFQERIRLMSDTQVGWPTGLNQPVLHASLILCSLKIVTHFIQQPRASRHQELQLEATKFRMAGDPRKVLLLHHTGQAGHQGQPDSGSELIIRLRFSWRANRGHAAISKLPQSLEHWTHVHIWLKRKLHFSCSIKSRKHGDEYCPVIASPCRLRTTL